MMCSVSCSCICIGLCSIRPMTVTYICVCVCVFTNCHDSDMGLCGFCYSVTGMFVCVYVFSWTVRMVTDVCVCVCVCSNCCNSGFVFVFSQTVATLDSDKDVCVFDSTATDMASSDIQIVYVPSHLYHMLFELFKVRTLQLCCNHKRYVENRYR